MKRLSTGHIFSLHGLPEGEFSVPYTTVKVRNLHASLPHIPHFKTPLDIGIVLGWPRCVYFIFWAVGNGPIQNSTCLAMFFITVINSESVPCHSLGASLSVCLSVPLSVSLTHRYTTTTTLITSITIISLTLFLPSHTHSNNSGGVWEVGEPIKQTNKTWRVRQSGV